MSPMQLDQAVRAHAPKGDAQPARTTVREPAGCTLPPVMIYLPGLPKKEANSTSRIAELMTIKLTNGPGAFETEAVLSLSKHLSDGQRIVEAKRGPVLDLYMLDYRDRLRLVDVTGTGVGAAVRRFVLALWYFLRAFALVLNAGKNAKSRVAKLQLLVGFGAVLVLLASVVFTVLAVLVSLGLWKDPFVTGNAADAIALGATAFTTWLFFSARPTILASVAQIEQFLDYAQNERYAAGVASGLDAALDDLLEAQPDRKIHLFGYSFGALVAMDYLYPRKSLWPTLDPRHAKAISTLVTVGCPIDFVRLYVSDYAGNREARVENLRWINVFIPADVLGSNFSEHDDFTGYTEKADETAAVMKPQACLSYTNEKLSFWNIWNATGFFSHGGYWDEAGNENCLHLVIPEVVPASQRLQIATDSAAELYCDHTSEAEISARLVVSLSRVEAGGTLVVD